LQIRGFAYADRRDNQGENQGQCQSASR